MRVFVSSSRDVFHNLAWEELLMERAAQDGEPVLAFYVNDGAVVLGRNQNPWREANLPFVRAQGLALARRISGGGTVYHDGGNLNYSVMLPRADYQRDRLFAVILDALARVGITAERSGSHSLVADGRKFSGSAFCFRREQALHHGTLLVNADLSRLAASLEPFQPDVETKAIASVPAAVVNLSELVPGLVFAPLQEALQTALASAFSSPVRAADGLDPEAEEVLRLADRNRSWGWVYGESPVFRVPVPTPDGQVLWLTVQEGCLSGAGEEYPGHSLLAGARWERATLEERLAAAPPPVRAWWASGLESCF